MDVLAQLTDGCRQVFDHLPVAAYLVDADRRILLWNDACAALTGRRAEEVLGRRCTGDLLAHCDPSGASKCGETCPLTETMRDGHNREADAFLRHRAGHRIPVRIRAAAIRDEHGLIVGACESLDERPMSLPEPSPLPAPRENSVDSATELPSHQALVDRLAAEVEAFAHDGVPFGVLLLAIDGFDRLCANDGAIGAAHVLFATAQTMHRVAGAGNVVGRWSDGVFLAIVHGCSEVSLLASAITLERLAGLDAVPWWGDFLRVTLSAGGSVVRPGQTWEALVERADTALHNALKLGGNHAVVL